MQEPKEVERNFSQRYIINGESNDSPQDNGEPAFQNFEILKGFHQTGN